MAPPLLPPAKPRGLQNPLASAWNKVSPNYKWTRKAQTTLRPLIAAHGEEEVTSLLLWYVAQIEAGDRLPEIVYPANLIARWSELKGIQGALAVADDASKITEGLIALGWPIMPSALRRGVGASLVNYRLFLRGLGDISTPGYVDLARYLLANAAPAEQMVSQWYQDINEYYIGEHWCPHSNRWHLHHFRVTRTQTRLAQAYMGTGAAWETIRSALQREGENV